MDHNLEDTLNLEGAIDEMDFEHSEDTVVSQDITLNASDDQETDIPMKFDNVEQQPILMDTGNEEIIVTDFMGEQFTLQEYSIRDDQTSGATTTEESNIQSLLQSQSETMIDLQFEPQTTTSTTVRSDNQAQTKYISVKAAAPRPTVPRPVAIAPKPTKFITPVHKANFDTGKQYAIAPKPVALVVNKTSVNKVPLSGVVQSGAKGNTVLAQIGKQLVMMPAGGSQKIKLVSASNSGMSTVQYGQLISKNVSTTQGSKQVMAKVISQGQGSNQSAVLTKILPTGSSLTSPTRYVMQQKTIPISIGNNKVLLASPTKQGKKQQIIAIKSTPSTVQSQVPTTKKIVITANTPQNVMLKTATPKTLQMVNKEGKIVVHGQRSQLQKIDTGKSFQIQLSRLLNNPTTTVPKSAGKQTSTLAVPQKTFVLSYRKGNLIQTTAEKVLSEQPPPLVITGSTSATAKTASLKPQQKLVRIAAAPAATKVSHVQPSRSAQSLLAPISTVDTSAASDDMNEMFLPRVSSNEEVVEEAEVDEHEGNTEIEEEEIVVESKEGIQALVAETVEANTQIKNLQEVKIEYDRSQNPIQEESMDSIDQNDSSTRSDEHPLIVIPSNYTNTQDSLLEVRTRSEEHGGMNHLLTVEEVVNPYQSPTTPQPLSDSEVLSTSTELGFKPRKGCNCSKSQCLKLYCDCFANGEFCNRCNCLNCHNNLDNEELRQRAIRACLDRNPDAFRPKIGKSKTGGPDIIRRHNRGCNCKRSGCLKNYCECYEAKIACTATCRCVGCRNVEETFERGRRRPPAARAPAPAPPYRPPPPALAANKQPCSFMTMEVIEAVCQCMVAAGSATGAAPDPLRDVIDEFSRCLQDIIGASHHAAPLHLADEGTT